MALRPAAPHHEDGHTERWCLSAWLPNDLAPGQYQVFVHGGHGGDYGWSEPLTLNVTTEPAPAGPVVNVRDLGAKGDGVSDDTESLAAALKQAAGGGTVLLPPGTYAISRSLAIPEQVIVRGTGMHQSIITNLEPNTFRPGELTDAPRRAFRPALVQGMGRFVLQDLTLRFMPATAPALEIGRDEVYVEDVGLYRVRFESRQDYGLSAEHSYTNSPVSIFNARRLRMIRCETFGPGGVNCQRKLESCQFSQNRFVADRRWRGHIFKFWGAEHCIFEDNLLTGDTRGLVMQTHFGVNYQNFIAGNTVERTVLGGNAGETYLVEGAGLFLESPVEAATPTTVTTARWPQGHDEAKPHRKVVGRTVVVARGRGLGQWRRISAVDTEKKTITVDRPWRIVPDGSSTVVIMNGLVETVFVNNQEVDCAKGLYLYYAGAINNIVDRHICDRSLGVTLMTHDDRQAADAGAHETAPDFFNLIRDCRVSDGGGIVVGAGGRMPETDQPALPWANFGNRVIGNEILRTVPFSGARVRQQLALGRRLEQSAGRDQRHSDGPGQATGHRPRRAAAHAGQRHPGQLGRPVGRGRGDQRAGLGHAGLQESLSRCPHARCRSGPPDATSRKRRARRRGVHAGTRTDPVGEVLAASVIRLRQWLGVQFRPGVSRWFRSWRCRMIPCRDRSCPARFHLEHGSRR